MEKFYTYIIQSLKDQSFYVGYTSDLQKRISYHNNKLSKYTSSKIPWKLIYYEEFQTKSEAIKREKQLKKKKSKSYIQKHILKDCHSGGRPE